MSNFRYRWEIANGDIRMHFWSHYLITKRLFRGFDSSGRKLAPCPIGRVLF
jgi:hypothetical protein